MSDEADKRFKGAPFGSQASRFDISGIHPKWKVPGTFTHTAQGASHCLGPGSYDVLQYNEFSSKSVEAKTKGPNWKRAYDVEAQSRIPHLLYKDQHQQRLEQRRKLGPGYYEVAEPSKHSVSNRGLLDSLEPRFRSQKEQEGTPGPGCYGNGGVPHRAREEAEQQRRHPGQVGMLQCGGSGRALPPVGCEVGPGTYNIPSSSDELVAKRAGKNSRGPYEVFSLDRNQAIMTGHYARMPAGNLGPGQYQHRDGLAEMSQPAKKSHGRFLRMEQYPAKPCDRIYWMTPATAPPDPANKVSPATYQPSDPNFKKESFMKSKPGFMSKCNRQDRRSQMFFTKNFNPVGPGRYDIQREEDHPTASGHTNVFKSKSDARLNHARQMLFKERLRDKDTPPAQKFLVDHVATVKEPCVNIQPLFERRHQLMIQ